MILPSVGRLATREVGGFELSITSIDFF